MAGDWIKMRDLLVHHPKVKGIAKALMARQDFLDWLATGVTSRRDVSGTSCPDLSGTSCRDNVPTMSQLAVQHVVVALLLQVWSIGRGVGYFVGVDLVLEHTTPADLDFMAKVNGVGAAMLDAGWAVQRDGAIILPKFFEHNVPRTSGEIKREQRLRKAAAESEKAAADSNGKPASDSTSPVTSCHEMSGHDVPDNVRGRGEERRGEYLKTEENPPSPPEGGTSSTSSATSACEEEVTPKARKRKAKPPEKPAEGFLDFWAVYPKLVAKVDAIRAWNKLAPDAELTATIVAAVRKHKTWRQWQDGIIPNPATWLNGRRWEDQAETPRAGGGGKPPERRASFFDPEEEAWLNQQTGDRSSASPDGTSP